MLCDPENFWGLLKLQYEGKEKSVGGSRALLHDLGIIGIIWNFFPELSELQLEVTSVHNPTLKGWNNDKMSKIHSTIHRRDNEPIYYACPNSGFRLLWELRTQR